MSSLSTSSAVLFPPLPTTVQYAVPRLPVEPSSAAPFSTANERSVRYAIALFLSSPPCPVQSWPVLANPKSPAPHAPTTASAQTTLATFATHLLLLLPIVAVSDDVASVAPAISPVDSVNHSSLRRRFDRDRMLMSPQESCIHLSTGACSPFQGRHSLLPSRFHLSVPSLVHGARTRAMNLCSYTYIRTMADITIRARVAFETPSGGIKLFNGASLRPKRRASRHQRLLNIVIIRSNLPEAPSGSKKRDPRRACDALARPDTIGADALAMWAGVHIWSATRPATSPKHPIVTGRS